MYVCGYGSWRTNVLYWTFRFMALPWPTFMVRQGQPSISSFDDLPPIYIWLLGTEVLPLPPTIHTYRHIRIRIYIYLFMCIYIYMYAYMCMYIRMDHKDMHAYTHKHTLHTYIHTYIHTYMHTSRLWYTHNRYIHMSMHVYRYAY